MGSGDMFTELSGEKGQLVSALLQVISGLYGGLGGMVHAFSENGLDDVVSSWVGSGENRPISESQIEQGFGRDGIRAVADKAGQPPDAVRSRLSGLLPDLVDKLTPEGKVPAREGNLVDRGLELLKGGWI